MTYDLIYRRFADPERAWPIPPPPGKYEMVSEHYRCREEPRVGESFLDYWERVRADSVLLKTTTETWTVEL